MKTWIELAEELKEKSEQWIALTEGWLAGVETGRTDASPGLERREFFQLDRYLVPDRQEFWERWRRAMSDRVPIEEVPVLGGDEEFWSWIEESNLCAKVQHHAGSSDSPWLVCVGRLLATGQSRAECMQFAYRQWLYTEDGITLRKRMAAGHVPLWHRKDL